MFEPALESCMDAVIKTISDTFRLAPTISDTFYLFFFSSPILTWDIFATLKANRNDRVGCVYAAGHSGGRTPLRSFVTETLAG